MREAPLRNIGIIAHIDAGKTTFSERLLFFSGAIRRMGEVHEGASTMDFLPEEQERGITIASACVRFTWKECSVNLIDTPGHVDFGIEVERSLRVLDAAVGVFCGVSGVEAQSEQVWRQSEKFSLPKLAVINKLDREGADFNTVVRSIEQKLRCKPLPLTVPYYEAGQLVGILDIVRGKKILFDATSHGKIFYESAFDDYTTKIADPYYEQLLDVLTVYDDSLTEEALAGTLGMEQLAAAIKRAVHSSVIVPVFAISALKNIGVQPVMDAVCDYLPSPEETTSKASQIEGFDTASAFFSQKETLTKPEKTTRLFSTACRLINERLITITPNILNSFCAFIFAVHRHKKNIIVFVRAYAGNIKPFDDLINMRSGKRSTVQKIYRVFADSYEELEEGRSGDIFALEGLEDAVTGDTLVVPEGAPVFLDPVTIGTPVLSEAFEPVNEEEGEILDQALALYTLEDPTLRFEKKDGERILSGMGELHLEIIRERIEREYHITIRAGRPQVIRLEVPVQKGKAENEFIKKLNDGRHYGRVALSISPAAMDVTQKQKFLHEDMDNTILFSDETSALPKRLQQSVRDGILAAMGSGPAGYAIVCSTVVVQSVHMEDSSNAESGVREAAFIACHKALSTSGTLILEPLMRITVSVPEEYLGKILSLLSTSGCKIGNIMDKQSHKEVQGEVFMRNLFGFATKARSASQGKADFSMIFQSYSPV